MKNYYKASSTLLWLGATIVGLCLIMIVSGVALATPLNYGDGAAPMKWPVGNQTHPKIIKICIQEDPNKPPDRSALLKEGMERWNAELSSRGLKLEVTIGIPDPPTGCDVTCKYGNAGDCLPMDQGDSEAPKLNGNQGLAGPSGGDSEITGGEILIKANLPAHNDRWKEKIRNLGAHEITHILGLADDDDGNVTDHEQGLDRVAFNDHDRAEISTLYPVLGQSDSKATGTQQSMVPHQYDWKFTYVGPEDGHVTLINLDIDPRVISAVVPPPGWVVFNPADPAHLLADYSFYQGYMVDGHPVPAPWYPEIELPLGFRADSAEAALSVAHPVEVFTLIAKDDITGEIPVWAGGDVEWLEGPVPGPAIGGTILPTNRLGLTIPWIILGIVIAVVAIWVIIWNRIHEVRSLG